MASPAFNRGISCKFVTELNKEYDKGGWWKSLVYDRETFVAIRGGYLNVYYRGCSLIMLEHKDDRLVGEISYKYLLHPGLKPETVNVIYGIPCLESLRKSAFISTLSEVGALKKAAEPYADGENIGVHHIIHNNMMVSDVEVAFGNNERRQVDFAALNVANGSIEIRFYEAKLFSNSYLRTNENGRLKVLNQVNRYSELLKKYCNDVMESYHRVCCKLLNLKGIADRRSGTPPITK